MLPFLQLARETGSFRFPRVIVITLWSLAFWLLSLPFLLKTRYLLQKWRKA